MFDAYWDAGWQVHVHVNGDLGLEVLLDVIEDAQRRTPRTDHRTVIVHFANSTEEQTDRISRLGAVVSANPYYPVGFADKYGEWGWAQSVRMRWSGPRPSSGGESRCPSTPTCRCALPTPCSWHRSG